MELPIRVLFLCTGNSCRSIIAEALANQKGGGALRAFSAGSRPTGQVNPNALVVLKDHGVPPGEPRSESLDAFESTPLDLVISVCDAAAGESCPVWLGEAIKAHWGVPDPADVTDPALIAPAFERTFRQMEQRLEALLALPLQRLSPAELTASLEEIQRDLTVSEA